MKRRIFLEAAGAAIALAAMPKTVFPAESETGLLKPKALARGDTIGVIAPGTAVSDPDDLAAAKEALEYFGLKMKIGPHVAKGSGYKTRTVEERLEDLHDMFDDGDINAVFAIRGGYGSAQLLDKIDYELIRDNPKIFLGYSDITALHTAINKYSGLVTFHGPVMLSSFTEFSAQHFRKVLFERAAPGILLNPDLMSGIRRKYPLRTVAAGRAEGITAGGNLSIISSLMGTPYELDSKGKILFLEDVGEQPYRIDRMLTQLRLAGKFESAAGIVFGLCSGCGPGGSQSSVWDPTLGEVLDNILGDLDIPVLYGLLFGHTSDQLTIPFGVRAKMDSEKQSVEIVESGVA